MDSADNFMNLSSMKHWCSLYEVGLLLAYRRNQTEIM